MEKWQDYVLLWGLYLIALIFMILRIASRISIRERLKADDYFAFSSFALLSVGTAIHTAAVSPYIDGFNIAQNNPNFKSTVAENPALREDAIAVFRYSFATLIIFWLTVWCVKFSMLFFIRPIMVPIPVYLEGWYIVFGFTVMNLIGCFIIQFFGCLPFGLNFSFKNDNCVSGNSTEPGKLYGTTALDTLSDMMIVILPTRHLFELPATKKQKAGLVVIFALGWIIVALPLYPIYCTTTGDEIDNLTNALDRIFSRPSHPCHYGRKQYPWPNQPALACNLESCGMRCCGDCGLSSANMGWLSEAMEESA